MDAAAAERQVRMRSHAPAASRRLSRDARRRVVPRHPQLSNIRGFILMEAKEKADEIRMKARRLVDAALAARRHPARAPSPQAKADADLERQTQVLTAKTKVADEYDRKEKNMAVELRMW